MDFCISFKTKKATNLLTFFIDILRGLLLTFFIYGKFIHWASCLILFINFNHCLKYNE